MNNYFKTFFLFFINTIFFNNSSLATFSIIALDLKTNESGSALGTCYSKEFKMYSSKLKINLADYVVFENNGFGIMNIQSDINDLTPIWLATAKGILAQDEPFYSATIIRNFLTHPNQDYRYKDRQMLILKKDKYFNVTGDIYHGENVTNFKTGRIRFHINDRFSIATAGNYMTNTEAPEIMEKAFIAAEGNLSDKLVAALNSIGITNDSGDSRCRTTEGVSANFAFLRTFHHGKLKLDLNVITDEEEQEATFLLKEKYEFLQDE
ncbi:DUF1028 domain-containing protein [Pigmentibacter sp. JX0631]|uniref:DUF1028 domain-containing protein n=1 Tax=Pigmentibacter sp. JX0631 TaxID=2976982 RepID=UPI00246907DF|nr:DUF1028 domain-containing protein [Pigmentibacter sp. JX0631]WGL59077.1 DUF1028 domain-containing protein [Pigmentibacter sp. JX0631]